MQKSRTILPIIAAILFSFSSCEEVIDVDLPNGGERLVIEASIGWQKETLGKNQLIKLSTSTPYYDKKKALVTGALVSVKNENTGTTFNFLDQNNGNYATNSFIPKLGDLYSLKIQYQGKQYKAIEKMIPVPTIDSIKTSQFEFFKGTTNVIEAYYTDSVTEENFYITKFDYKEKPSLGFKSDKVSNGNKNYVRFSDEDLTKGDIVTINFFGVSKSYYQYMRKLNSQAGNNGGSPFQTPPAKLYGNCINSDDPTEEVLGFFTLNEFVNKTYTVE